jgi:hypothetical protein
MNKTFNFHSGNKFSNVFYAIYLICGGVSDKLSSALIFKHQMRKLCHIKNVTNHRKIPYI